MIVVPEGSMTVTAMTSRSFPFKLISHDSQLFPLSFESLVLKFPREKLNTCFHSILEPFSWYNVSGFSQRTPSLVHDCLAAILLEILHAFLSFSLLSLPRIATFGRDPCLDPDKTVRGTLGGQFRNTLHTISRGFPPLLTAIQSPRGE